MIITSSLNRGALVSAASKRLALDRAEAEKGSTGRAPKRFMFATRYP